MERAIKEHFGAGVARHTTIEAVTGDVVGPDDLHLDPAIVKIDAEGFDYDILLGLAQTIARSRPFIVIEVAWAEQGQIEELLKTHDYVLTGYDIAADCFATNPETLRSRMPKQRNFFAIPKEKMNALPLCH